MDPSNIPPGLVHVQRQERDGLLTVSLLRNVISFVHDFDSVVNQCFAHDFTFQTENLTIGIRHFAPAHYAHIYLRITSDCATG